MNRLICGICMEELGSEKDVCSLPCGHVKHIACLTEWSKVRKECPDCSTRFNLDAAFHKRLYFNWDPNADHKTHMQLDSVLAANEALRYQLEESKAEVDAAQTRVNDLEESNSQLRGKLENSEAQLQQSSERNRQLTAELHTLEGKNRETLERNRELEQELSNAQAKIRNQDIERNRQLTAELHTLENKNRETLKRNRSLEQKVSNSQGKIQKLEVKYGPIDGAHNRAKLYALSDQGVWDDRGTGHVDCVQSRDQPDAWWMVVQLGSNEKNVLESMILTNTIYEKQRGKWIVWSKSGVSKFALSFQEKSGCKKIWDKICQIQGKDPDVENQKPGSDADPAKRARIGTNKKLDEACAKQSPNVASTSKAVIMS
ncbi:ring finger domain-containing protein [Ditylenchus destructor]|nr:ring finger domain-containing protein [Ditylenchus destructor]